MNGKRVKLVLVSLLVSNFIFGVGFFLIGIKYDVFYKVTQRISGTQTVSGSVMKYMAHTSLYDIYSTQEADIVMLGDSITLGADWNELMGRGGIVNRGIGSDTTEGVLNRLDYIYNLHPKKCFVLIGINDLGHAGRSVDETFENYKKIVENLKDRNITPVIQSTLYTSSSNKNYKKVNEKVSNLNDLLSNYAVENDIEYVDLNKNLSLDRELKAEFTYDGVHLLGNAYKVWGETIEDILSNFDQGTD